MPLLVKGNNVSEAIETALAKLDASRDEVEVEIVQKESTSFLGLKKTPAIVKVVKKTSGQPMNNEDEISESLLNFPDPQRNASPIHFDEDGIPIEKEALPNDVNTMTAAAWIENGKLFVKQSEIDFPNILPTSNVKIVVNGDVLTEERVITADDHVDITPLDDEIPMTWDIILSQDKMKAFMKIIPGKKISRVLIDSGPVLSLEPQVEETVVTVNDLTPQDIQEKLIAMNIEKGWKEDAIIKATKILEEAELLIAEGVHVVEGRNGEVEFQISIEQEKTFQEEDTINYREFRLQPTVDEGQVIAKVIPSSPGVDGINLFGDMIQAKKVQDVVPQLGKNIELNENQEIVSLIYGRPEIHKRGFIIKIDVLEKLVHSKNVDLASGNIKFFGDIDILGNVEEAMEVESQGIVHLFGFCTNASIHAGNSIVVNKNVLSSSLSAGQNNVVASELIVSLIEINSQMESIVKTIKQLMSVEDVRRRCSQPGQFLPFLRRLVEQKYSSFRNNVKEFLQQLEDNKASLDEEWERISKQLHLLFVDMRMQQTAQFRTLEQLVIQNQKFLQEHTGSGEESVIKLPYAINSRLHCSGDILVNGQGLYNCEIQAGGEVQVKGILRGGAIYAGKHVLIREAGSRSGVKTFIKVGKHGIIKIEHVFDDVTIQIGKHSHTFNQERENVHAFVDSDGTLIL